MDLVLYGHPDSGHACKAALALALAGQEFRAVWIDIWADPATRPAAFLANSPLAEVPLLMIDGTPYVQSGAILLEIACRFNCLGAETAEGLRKGREILLWEANRLGLCLPWLRLERQEHGRGFPGGTVDWLRARYALDSARFETLLGAGPFFHGDSPGIGDCAIWGYTQWLDEAGVAPTSVMEAWLNRMQGLSAMRAPVEFFPEPGPVYQTAIASSVLEVQR